MITPEDLKSLLDGFIDIIRGTKEFETLYTQFQATPSKDNLKLLRDKETDLDTLLEFYEDRLDQINEKDYLEIDSALPTASRSVKLCFAISRAQPTVWDM